MRASAFFVNSSKAFRRRFSWFAQIEIVEADSPSLKFNVPSEKSKPAGIVTVFDDEKLHCIIKSLTGTTQPH